MAETIKKEWSKETLEAVEKLCLFDDDFMSLCFERNKDATEYLINTILERDDLKVIEVQGQKEYKNPYFDGRVIKIDIYAKDSNDKVYDIEVQRADAGAIPRRARFHGAMVDVRMLKEKQKFKEIEDSYIIFITQNDIMKKGLPLYHVERIVKETGEKFDDGSHIIYVNGSYQNDDDPIGRLVHDFRCVKADDIYNDLLRKQVNYFKETRGGQSEMCEIIDNLAEKRAEERADKREDSVLIEKIKTVMKKLNSTAEKAMEFLDIPKDRWSHYKSLL